MLLAESMRHLGEYLYSGVTLQLGAENDVINATDTV
jgi:hypothetical protein